MIIICPNCLVILNYCDTLQVDYTLWIPTHFILSYEPQNYSTSNL